jgi:FkbM family methyltransferase
MKRRLINKWNATKDRFTKSVAEITGLRPLCSQGRDELDRKLQDYLPSKGTYIEAGALDGFWFSNTYFLDRVMGWDGLLVEPNPPHFAACSQFRKRARVVNCALVAFGFTNPTVTLNYGADLTWVDGAYDGEELECRKSLLDRYGLSGEKIIVPARTLQSLIDENGLQVDFLSLDVEGYEGSVLRGVDLNRSAPKAILAECSTPERLEEVKAVLDGHYQSEILLTHHDYLFLIR